MKYGRIDRCTPEIRRGNAASFPNPREGYPHVRDWCSEQFGLNIRQCTAVMGKLISTP